MTASNRLSICLKGLGVKKDDKVAILHPNCHCYLEAYYGIAQIGAISVPINHRLSPGEIAFILEDSESKILIADPMFQKQMDSIRGGDETGLDGFSGRERRNTLPEPLDLNV